MPKTLLLADDSVTIQKVVGISFASEDITLITVDNGDDAIVKAREIRPDMVLADVVMPGKNGYEVCEAIKSDPDLQHIPVLLLTGTFEAFDETRAQQIGAEGHVAKPFEAQTLVDQVNQLFELSEASPEAPVPAAEAQPLAALPDPLAAVPVADPSAGNPFGETSLDDAFDDLIGAAPLDPLAPASDAGDLDFFGDDFAQPTADTAAAPEATVVHDAGSFDSDGAFSFGEDLEESAPSGPPPVQRAADGPTAVGPIAEASAELPTLAAELLDPDFSIPADDLLTPQALPTDPPPGPELASDPATELFDGAFGSGALPEDVAGSSADDSLLRIDSQDLAQAPVIDPGSGLDFDVSNSDLGDPIAQVVQAPAAAPAIEAPGIGLFDKEPASEPALAKPPAAAAAALPSTNELARSALEQVGPQIREQLHDTLEKVAWESFGSLT